MQRLLYHSDSDCNEGGRGVRNISFLNGDLPKQRNEESKSKKNNANSAVDQFSIYKLSTNEKRAVTRSIVSTNERTRRYETTDGGANSIPVRLPGRL